MAMSITQETVCICDTPHEVPITDHEVFRILDEMWDGRAIEIDMTFEQIRDEGDFTENHVSPELWARYVQALNEDLCPWGLRHRHDSCTTDCALD
jgi:hypothetical protein